VREQRVLTRLVYPHLVRTTSQCTKHVHTQYQRLPAQLTQPQHSDTVRHAINAAWDGHTQCRYLFLPNPPGHLALEAARLTRWGHAPCQGAACHVFWRTGFLTSSQGSWSLLCQRTRSASAHALLCPYSIQALERKTCIHAPAHPQPTSQPEAAAGGGASPDATSILCIAGCLRICYSACGQDNESCNTHRLPAPLGQNPRLQQLLLSSTQKPVLHNISHCPQLPLHPARRGNSRPRLPHAHPLRTHLPPSLPPQGIASCCLTPRPAASQGGDRDCSAAPPPVSHRLLLPSRGRLWLPCCPSPATHRRLLPLLPHTASCCPSPASHRRLLPLPPRTAACCPSPASHRRLLPLLPHTASCCL
jgi:hypothetical protein